MPLRDIVSGVAATCGADGRGGIGDSGVAKRDSPNDGGKDAAGAYPEQLGAHEMTSAFGSCLEAVRTVKEEHVDVGEGGGASLRMGGDLWDRMEHNSTIGGTKRRLEVSTW